MWWSKACFPFRMSYFLLLCRVWVWLQSRVWWLPSKQLTREKETHHLQQQCQLWRAISESREAPCFTWTLVVFDVSSDRLTLAISLVAYVIYTPNLQGSCFGHETHPRTNKIFYASCHDSFLVMKHAVVTLIHQGNPRWGNSLFDGFPFKESLSCL